MSTEVKNFTVKSTWREVGDAARTTVNLNRGQTDPSSRWKKQILLAEHSPIRQFIIKWKWINLKYWVSVHFVRHKIGIEHFVSTQRTNRTGIDRESKEQSSFINHECISNAQAIINISRKRLCKNASQDTQKAWTLFLDKLKEIEPELHQVCVPECLYRGFCPEFSSCGFHDTNGYKKRLKEYRSLSQDN